MYPEKVMFTGLDWTIENIKSLKERCIKEGKKFSKKLREELNKGCPISMKKPKFAQALAEYCEEEHLPEDILELLKKLR